MVHLTRTLTTDGLQYVVPAEHAAAAGTDRDSAVAAKV